MKVSDFQSLAWDRLTPKGLFLDERCPALFRVGRVLCLSTVNTPGMFGSPGAVSSFSSAGSLSY